MDNINALPDLVIRGVLSHLIVDLDFIFDYAKELKGYFYFLHVSSRWRRLGVPLVYSTAFVEAKYTRFCTNIDLVSGLGVEHLVKKLDIGFEDNFGDFSKLLEPLLGIFNLGSVDLPEEHDSPPSKELLSKILTLVQCLATRFPYVSSLDITLDLSHEIVRQLTNQLVTTFSDRLVSLYLHVNTPIDLEYFPASLKHLIFRFNKLTGNSLPKICDPSKLQSLRLHSAPYNFYWEDLIPVPSEFTNLRSLSLDLEDYEDWDDIYIPEAVLIERNPPPQRLQLSLPHLVDLDIRKTSEGDCLKFDPVLIPSRLNEVHLHVTLEGLKEFCNLPINYIRHMSFGMGVSSRSFTGDFYATTNKFLGKIGNSGGTASITLYSKYGECEMDLDIQQIEWYNVTKLQFSNMKPSVLLSLLAKLPLVTSIGTDVLRYEDYKPVGFQHVSMVEKIRIKGLEYKCFIDGATEFVVAILKQHSCVNNLLLPGELVERVKEIIDVSASTYPHWQQITVAEAENPY